MNWLDLAIIAVIAWSTFRAFRTGLIRQVVMFASVIVGALVAGSLYARLASNIEFLVADERTRSLLAFVAIFAGFIVVGQVLATLVKTTASLLFLGPLDHLGGAVFGLVQGLLTVELRLFAATTFPVLPPLNSALNDSKIAPVLIARLPLVERLLPAEFRAALDAFRQGVPLPSLPGLPGLPSLPSLPGLPDGFPLPGSGR